MWAWLLPAALIMLAAVCVYAAYHGRDRAPNTPDPAITAAIKRADRAIDTALAHINTPRDKARILAAIKARTHRNPQDTP